MDLEAGNALLQRRRLDIEETDGRGADQHQLAGQPLACHLSSQQRPGRDIEMGALLCVVHPQAAMAVGRSEEHTSELQSLMRISYAVFCLNKKRKQHKSNATKNQTTTHIT